LLAYSPVTLAEFLLVHTSQSERTTIRKPEPEILQDSIAGLNLRFAILAALSQDVACACLIAQRLRTSSAAFLKFPQTEFEANLQTLHQGGLLDTMDNAVCSAHCEHRFLLTTSGRDLLSEYLDQLQFLSLAAVRGNAMNG